MTERPGIWTALGLRVAAVAFGFFVAIACAEIALRFLPVVTGLMAQPVDAEHPVFHFQPDRPYIWSVGWDLSVVSRGRVNNVGFINDQDYDSDSETPLLAVIGDSYIEALMVPYVETMHGRLAAAFAGRGRVYSFAASGAPLSQYLIWAQYAHQRFGADGLVVVIVGNDFDESLATYKQGPGFHHFVESPGDRLALHLFEYAPNPLRKIVRRSALARYLVFNLHAEARLQALFSGIAGVFDVRAAEVELAAGEQFVGNTPARADADRITDSLRAVDAFLHELPERAGLPVERIGFVVDGLRPQLYDGPEAVESVRTSYFAVMRDEFMTRAERRGYEVIDLNEVFMGAYRHHGQRFEFAHDSHWNRAGHEVVSRAVAASRVAAIVFDD
jgi:hypothetical protein